MREIAAHLVSFLYFFAAFSVRANCSRDQTQLLDPEQEGRILPEKSVDG